METNKSMQSSLAEKLNKMNGMFNLKHEKSIDSLIAISRVVFAFTLLFVGAFLYKLFTINPDTNHFRQVLSGVNILPLYKEHFTAFLCMCVYDVLRLLLIGAVMFFFTAFLKSLDRTDPFKNLKSKEHITLVAFFALLFFVADGVGSIHLSYFEELLTPGANIRIFHFEYLMLAYFLNVFAFIFKKGVDLNNEIDLVI
ncbi:MAG: DUF2975 domain-containing protein [Bacteroidia bacterium]|nr:DUF2975 domain-containing protein [Bacteroidia bacterium]